MMLRFLKVAINVLKPKPNREVGPVKLWIGQIPALDVFDPLAHPAYFEICN
jgi:hypothetical protein